MTKRACLYAGSAEPGGLDPGVGLEPLLGGLCLLQRAHQLAGEEQLEAGLQGSL
jgi:hypothetical protein